MKHNLARLILCLIVAAALTGCSTWKQGEPLPIKKSPLIDNGPMFSPKADAFLVILDASSSMDKVPVTYNKFDAAKNIVDRMNQMLPEYEMTAGLRSFGHHPDLSQDPTQLVYGMTAYNTEGFGSALNGIVPAGGTSPLEEAFDGAIDDFSMVSGKKAVIVVSDGKDMSPDVLPAARKLAEAYGDTLCIYPILLGNDPEGLDLMTQIAGLTGCGFLTRDTDLIDNDGLNTFVHKVFLEEAQPETAAPLDSDNDGVVDARDLCPNTPAGTAVTENGCPIPPVTVGDEDGDGVMDDVDKCPGTPQGATVGINGCWNTGDVFFGFDRFRIRPEGKVELDKVAGILNQNPDLRVKLQGHTCDIGSKAYNLGLSQRRADAVKEYLVDEGVSADRLETEGVGFSMPLVPNTTAENRAKNRRTEIHPID